MADRSNDICPTVNKEDIAVIAPGTVVLGPATIWTMVISKESSGQAVINFSDDTATYTASHKVLKAVITGAGTLIFPFTKGLSVTRGLIALASAPDVDISIVYE